jgi:LAO/AO transport system kinase
VALVSALDSTGIEESWALVEEFRKHTSENGYFAQKRREQARYWLDLQLREAIYRRFARTAAGRDQFEQLEAEVLAGKLATRLAVARLLTLNERET